MLRLASDLYELCAAAVDGKLGGMTARWDPRHALGVVLAAGGYPGSYERGMAISGLDTDAGDDCKVFHAGTMLEGATVRTSGGRVLCVTALGDDIAAAQKRAYARVDTLCWEGIQFRRDIGWRALQRYSQQP
jgi:phosphoribosylamine--glycine ligase